MSEAKVVSLKEGGTGWLVFSNPGKRNAVTFEMWSGLPGQLAAFAEDPEVKVVMLRGEGETAFVSGADISQFGQNRGSAEASAAYNAATTAAYAAVEHCPKPTLAMIRGYCIGGGLGIALGCDIRIAAEDARFAIPAAKLGLGYGFEGVRRLVEVVGPAFAKEILFTARQFGAEEALRMGLVNWVVPADALAGEAADLAERIAGNAPLTIRAAKLAADTAASGARSPERMAAIEEAVAACFASEDYREGRLAFAEKRQPRFFGR